MTTALTIPEPAQLPLLEPASAPLPRRIDLRCCSIDLILAELAAVIADGRDSMRPHLVIGDPPWPRYKQQPGDSDTSKRYTLLTYPEIYAHLLMAASVSMPRGRLLLWCVWPMLVEWLVHARGIRQVVPKCWVPKSGGADLEGEWTGSAWFKDALTPNTGHHWQGDTEPALVFARNERGRLYTNKQAMVGNGWVSPRGRHSRKPPEWQARCIRRWVPKGGLVLDLYAGLGSGAEAVILAGEGRRYLGAEIDPQRYEEARALIHLNTSVRV